MAARKTRCKRGHERTPENLRPNGTCRICARQIELERQEQRRQAEGRAKRTVDPESFPCGHERTPENTRRNRNECKVCHREAQKRRHHDRPEEHRAKAREYAAAHRAEAKQRIKAWREANLEYVRALGRRRMRERVLAAKDPETLEWLDIIAADPCSYCGAPTEATDHIDPISRGGPNHWTNYTPACARCNGSKHATPLLRFLLRRQAIGAPPRNHGLAVLAEEAG